MLNADDCLSSSAADEFFPRVWQDRYYAQICKLRQRIRIDPVGTKLTLYESRI